MIRQFPTVSNGWRVFILAAVVCFGPAAASAQASPTAPVLAQSLTQVAEKEKPQAHISPEQAKQLFSLVDELIQFSSAESGLPVKSEVKRQLTSRNDVETYLKQKFDEDQGAKRMQQGEIVLKKFGLLDRDFALRPFLLDLLKEQIEAYYDARTKTISMLDWVDVEEQKPVMAHELTHALQDQHIDLDKWNDQTPSDVSLNAHDDTDHLARDEMDTAREAVAEGQATAVMMDYILKPLGKSLIKNPELIDMLKDQMTGSDTSPVLARAPILLSESLLFPYREGLSFEQDIWMDRGQAAAFTGALDHPPSSSWEIINPLDYEKRRVPAIPMLPNIHPLVDKLYKPYDIGQIGQLDLHILAKTFGGEQAARLLTPAWDGGVYWAGQRLDAKTPEQQNNTNSIALFYLSAWKNAPSAQAFARMYVQELGRKYSGLKPVLDAHTASPAALSTGSPETPEEQTEQLFTTGEGPVLITTRGKLVFVAESFPLDLARQLTDLILDAQGSGELQMAKTTPKPSSLPSVNASGQPLTGNLVRFLSGCGVMKAAVDAAIQSGK